MTDPNDHPPADPTEPPEASTEVGDASTEPGERPADAARRALRASRATEAVRRPDGAAPVGGEAAGAPVPGGGAGAGVSGGGAARVGGAGSRAGADVMVPGPGGAASRSGDAAAAEGAGGAVRPPGEGAGASEPGRAAPRPGDAARAALRRAVGGVASAAEPVKPDTPAPAPPAPTVPKPSATGARPADVAREALRAARAAARRAEEAREAAESEARRLREERTRAAGRPSPTSSDRTFPASADSASLSGADPGSLDGASPASPASPGSPASVDPAAPSSADSAFLTGAVPAFPASGDPGFRTGADRVAPARPRSRTSDPVAPAPAPGARARDVQGLLAGAFRMPSDEAEETEEEGQREGPAPAPGRAPRSMAAPSRDGDHRRTFPAFPSLATDGDGDVPFAETWWGNAWVTALEEGALDGKRLARGRVYAQQGHVDAITVTPGLVLAYVQGSRPRPYRVQVRLRTLDGEDWERFLDAAVASPAHIAALLDKELPESLAECGVPLLPGPGDLEPQCSCPDRGHPCKHAAALCYQTARLLDADPFVLLLLRGRGERELLDTLSRRNAVRAARAAQEQETGTELLPGVRATEALARAERPLPPLPAPLLVPPHPEQPPAYPSAPNGPDSFALDQLATDAAARAHALLATGHDDIGELTLWQDAVRLAAARPGSGLTAATRSLYASLAAAAGRTPSDLARAVAAWRQGGPDGLTVLEESWDPPAGRFDRARPLLLAADLPAFRPRRNHLTHPRGHLQLRFGRDGLWYPYESEPGREDWWPRGTPDPDPVGALTGLGGGPGEQ
ncbi:MULTISPECIES: SWIM zinc finger family protein [Streptomyces]|uniref:SWIM zinc finger family protein n=2 Tax=Streptomyces TaxID=1883 RepID=A0ABV9IIM1_9ACTN